MAFTELTEQERQALNLEYLPRLSVTGVDEHLERAATRSAAVRERYSHHADVSYGDSRGQTIDVFPARATDSPLHLFIHGGYWRALDKHFYTELAGPMVDAGAAAMLVNYDLCPAVTIAQIVAQVRDSIVFAHRYAGRYNADPNRIFVSGHSAGGHLTGMMMATDWQDSYGLPADLIKGAAPLSGLFDIEPHRHTDLQSDIRLSEADAAANSPQRLPLHFHGSVICAVGGGESNSFKRQSADFAQKCRSAGIDCNYLETGTDNHFEITDRLGDAADELTRALFTQMGL